MGRLGLGLVLVLRLGLGLALGLQLGIGRGFMRNHSWSSTFTPRRNHSLCLNPELLKLSNSDDRGGSEKEVDPHLKEQAASKLPSENRYC